MNKKKIYVAPLQGYTDAEFCNAHNHIYGYADGYFTPFMRVEKNVVRPRDINNLKRCSEIPVVPQLIFRDNLELSVLLAAVKEAGHERVDLNLGCPFPPQIKAGRGAAIINNPGKLEEALPLLEGIKVSVKMRLGMENPEEWKAIMPVLKKLNPEHVTLHPRIAAQQYGGELHMAQFEEFLAIAEFPVIYNGDIKTPDEIGHILLRYPSLTGVMTGRGLLGRPSLIAEYRTGKEWTKEQQLETVLRLHNAILSHYTRRLCGDAQILSKIQPFWNYLEPLIGKKLYKALTKTRSLTAYRRLIP